MTVTPDQIESWKTTQEVEHLEFKAATNSFHLETLLDYCGALANEGGGTLVLGMTNKLPREVCGTNAFRDLNQKKLQLLEKLRLRVDAHELQHDGRRVLVFEVPSRPRGRPVGVGGRYRMRVGESLVDMTADQLEAIHLEATPDFTAEVSRDAAISDLDPSLIQYFRTRWREKSGKTTLDRLSESQLLEDAELLVDGRVTFAALILLGTPKGVSRHLACAETVFEFRTSTQSIEAQQRKEFRRGFLGYLDELWDLVNLRNESQQLRQGLFVRDIPDLNEAVVREVLLNALAHRDYRDAGSVWVRQYPRSLQVVSPGGLPNGITVENIMFRQKPRNRRVAEALQKCGLVERANQGAKLMFQQSILEGKGFPDFSGTDDHQVSVTLRGEVADPRFVAYLNRLGEQRLRNFDLNDLLVLELIHKGAQVPAELREALERLKDVGAVESDGRGRGTRYILSKSFYEAIGERAAYTRKKGLDESEKKTLLLKHLRNCGKGGAPISELEEVVTGVPRSTLRRMLRGLRDEGLVELSGEKRWARWIWIADESI